MSYNYQDISSELPAFRNNVWISPDGSNEPGSSGTEEDPFRTITYVFSRIYSTENLQISVHLLDGVYSDTTNGEHFPIHMIDWVHIIGTEADFTILDAGGESRIFNFHNNDGSSLSNLTIQNGMELGDGYFHVVGGGILINNSNPTLNNVSVLNSQAKFGGGIFLKEANPILNNVTVSNNVANNMGGGICFFSIIKCYS